MSRPRWKIPAAVCAALAAISAALVVALKSARDDAAVRNDEPRPTTIANQGERASAATSLEAAPEEEVVAAGTKRAPPDGVWIRGRVVIPEGTPPDEHVKIAARVLSFDDAPGYVTTIDSEGLFSVMFPNEIETGWIELRGRYLLLQPNHPVDLETPPEEIVLEPELGGRVQGRIVLPEAYEEGRGALTSSIVELSADTSPGFRRFGRRRMIVGEDLRFEFGGLPAIGRYVISAEAKDFLRFENRFSITAGHTEQFEIALRSGVRISGRILDQGGKPIEGARIWKTAIPPPDDLRREEATATTGTDGGFVIRAIPPGDVAFVIRATGFLREVLELGRLEDGDARTGIEVRMRSSLVHGRVAWPDGSPVADAFVELVEVVRETPSPIRRSVDDGGRFEIEARTEGPFTISARAPSEPAVELEDLATSQGGFAHVAGVRPNSEPLIVVLQPAAILRGRVLDELGSPVPEFAVKGYQMGSLVSDPLNSSFESWFSHDRGEFGFVGLAKGSWQICAYAGNRRSQPYLRVDLPNQGAPLLLIIPRGTMVSGTVVDPEGRPVGSARLCSRDDLEVESDETGRFELSDLQAGIVGLWAESRNFAPSETVRLSLAPGEAISDVRLALRRAGSIDCRVVDAEGNPEPNRFVTIDCFDELVEFGSSSRAPKSTDAVGRVLFPNLPAGRYVLSKGWTKQKRSDEGESGGRSETSMCVSVLVEEGETSRVELGGVEGARIRVHGKVMNGETPVSGVNLAAWIGDHTMDGERSTTDETGRFDLFLSAPGNHVILLDTSDAQLRTLKNITTSPEQEWIIALPCGQLSGVVHSASGRHLDDAFVHLEPVRSRPQSEAWQSQGAGIEPEGGRFTFRNLPGGTYSLRLYLEGELQEEAERSGLVLEEGQQLEGIVLSLP